MENRRRQLVTVLLTLLLMTATVPIIGTQNDLASAGYDKASLTGVISDEGIDTDSDGTYDYLKIGVEVNVTVPENYFVFVDGLVSSKDEDIYVGSSNFTFLEAGFPVVYVYLDGERIHASHLNPTNVTGITLRDEEYTFLDSLSHAGLSGTYSWTDFDAPPAMLTGKISDRGMDTDKDGTFNYLEIGVEINVTEPGFYSVHVSGLRDKDWNWIDVWDSESGDLDVGISMLNVSLSGYRIRGQRLNASHVNQISLQDGYYMSIHDVNLSRVYLYTDFDAPAILTGAIKDQGLDTDDDGAYNLLEIGVEVNVSDPGNYRVSVSGLLDSEKTYIDVYASKSVYLEAGLQFVNLFLDGPRIYLFRRNPRYINHVSLVFWEEYEWREEYWHELNELPLLREYYYTEFDPPGAMLTGKIDDQGVDTDDDGYFDYLEVGVEVNVTEAGTYVLYVSGLRGADSGDKDEIEMSYISVWDSKTIDLGVGVHIVDLYLYGPQIYVSRRNATMVSYISVRDTGYWIYHSLHDVPLSKEYLYTQFDAPFTDVETKFVVYPDGRVAVEGALEYTNMYPKYTGPTMQGSFNLTSNQASAGLTLTVPPDVASEFPFNSTTANLLATYSDGLLNTEMNSTMILPPIAERQYPFNATDGIIKVTYSEGILNIEVEGNTTLPPIATSQFPFNATDLTLVGTYSPHTLDGTITFSVLPKFTFDDVNVDFTGNQTDLTLNGTVHVVFNVPLGDFIVHNETEIIQMIDQLKSDLVGEDGIVWNMTGGLLNVTNLEISYVLTDEGALLQGADVTFTMDVHGDFVRALAYVMSGGRNEMLLYPALNEAYESVQSGSFDIRYSRDDALASVKLTFSYDLNRLIDYVLTPPTGTTPFVVTGYGMSPTLWKGDVVMVEEVPTPGDIVANNETGDIIAFYSPDDPRYVIIHRAINKTFVDGTWYFTTKGDFNWYPDSWLVPESLVIGKAVRRIPLLGYLVSYPYLFYPYYYYPPYPQSTTGARLSLLKTDFSSVQSMFVQQSYTSVDKRFDFQYTQVDALKTLADEYARILPELLPPETPPEFKSIIESLLNTTYASVSTAQASLSYENGKADFKATATIEGDLNTEINYVKDLYFQLIDAQYSHYNMTLPWQVAFMNQTEVDVSNLRISAKLNETSFEGRIEGLTLMPPIDAINATHFKLERFFNLTAPQYEGYPEFPGKNQKLKITVEGGSNATHTVTIYSPPTVPEPDSVRDGKSMTWLNQTISGIQDLVFQIEERIVGTLTVTTTPVAGEVFVNGESWGIAPQSRDDVDVGTYNVSFGSVAKYYTPDWQLVTVEVGVETVVEGVYEPITGTLTIKTTPLPAEVFVNGTSWGITPQSREDIQIGTYIVSFGDLDGFTTPANQVATINKNEETTVMGVYEPLPGVIVEEITEPELVNATNPFIVDATEEAATSLIITEISDPITIVVQNVTERPEDVDPPPGTLEVLSNYVQITVNNTDITVNATIRIYYTLEQLEASGLDESTLEIRFWNATSGEWEPVESHVNTAEHYVWAIIDHFSLFAILGQPTEGVAPLPTQLLFLAIAVIVIIAVTLVYVIYFRKRKTAVTQSK